MIPDFVVAAAEGKDIVIYGDGSETDTYCFVGDIVDGLLKLMNYKIDEPVNLGSPERYTLLDIAKNNCLTESNHKLICTPCPF